MASPALSEENTARERHSLKCDFKMETIISPQNAHFVLAKMVEDRERKIQELRQKVQRLAKLARTFHAPESVVKEFEREES